MDDEQLILLPDLSDFGKIYKIPLFLKCICLCLVLPSTWKIEELLSNYLGKSRKNSIELLLYLRLF
jgi:hypothetical protein